MQRPVQALLMLMWPAKVDAAPDDNSCTPALLIHNLASPIAHSKYSLETL